MTWTGPTGAHTKRSIGMVALHVSRKLRMILWLGCVSGGGETVVKLVVKSTQLVQTCGATD